MKQYFDSIKLNENRRLRYFFLAYLFAGLIGLGIGVLFKTVNGIIAGIIMGYCIAWKLTELIRIKIKLPCPVCDSKELEESFTLQCKVPEYKCKDCGNVYKEGMLVEK